MTPLDPYPWVTRVLAVCLIALVEILLLIKYGVLPLKRRLKVKHGKTPLRSGRR